MALTIRSNGQQINSGWFNDFANLLTGAMADQPVTINNSLELTGLSLSPAAPTLALAASGTGLSVGSYTYAVSFVMGDGETVPGTTASVLTTTGNQYVNVTNIPLGPAGTTARKVWRSKVNSSSPLYQDNLISDNTTTSYTDQTADSGISVLVPPTTSIGGLIIKDSGGSKNFILGTNGDVIWKGKLGVATAGDTLDASASSLYLKAPGGAGNYIEMQVTNGSTSLRFKDNAIHVPSFLGIRTTSGTKLGEFKGNGNLTISGSQYQTTGGAISTVTGQSFDSFDVGEVFECDKEYPNGTVVCPGESNKLTQCSHDNCPFALIISHNPGLGLGVNDHPNGIHYVAMAGRINARTAQDIAPKTMVVSDGRGGVRAMKPGEPSFVLGFTLNETSVVEHSPTVGVFIRPLFITVRSR